MHNDNSDYKKMIENDMANMSKMLSSKGTTTVRIKNGVYEKVKEICEKDNLMLVDYINTAVAEKIIRDK